MTVNELIKILETLPYNLTAVGEGYETGFEPIKRVSIIKVNENRSREWWDGKFEKSDTTGIMKVAFLDTESKNISKSY
jgi:hypothetical protein